jgi:hypothetical protein
MMSHGRIGGSEIIVDKQERKAIQFRILSFDTEILPLATT